MWFYSVPTDRYFYVLRRDDRHPGCWALPGGKVEANETLLQAMVRECREELGFMPESTKMVPLEQFTNAAGNFSYHTFFSAVPGEFQPRLNHEHMGYAWIESSHWPRPLHPGLWNMINLDEISDKLNAIKGA